MKQLNITIHPFSALAGMALLGLVWVTAGAMPLQGSSSTRDVSAIEVVSDPHPRQFLRIVEGNPQTIPTDKYFIVKALGHNSCCAYPIQLLVDGVIETSGITEGTLSGFTSFVAVPQGSLIVSPGSTVAVTGGDSNPNDARVCGYLVDA